MSRKASIFSNTSKRQWLLAGVSLLLLVSLYFVPVYHRWINNKIWDYTTDIPRQMHHQDLHFRKAERFGNYYTTTQKLAEQLDSLGQQQALLLVPSSAYCKTKGIEYDVPEPVVFYYFTGVHTVWAKSEQANKATAAVYVENGNLKVKANCSPRAIDSFVRLYKPYPYTL